MKKILALTAVFATLAPFASHAQTVQHMTKQGTGFAVDGNRGAIEGQQLYLWQADLSNVNQQWVEASVGDGYFSYQKQNTALCIDGGQGGSLRQPVTLETCIAVDQNQHWEKISTSNGSFRLEKRGTDFSIDGNRNGTNAQAMYLWSSDDNNVNQQWQFSSLGGGTIIPTIPSPTTPAPQPEDDKPDANVFNLTDLRDAMQRDNQTVVVQSGDYSITELASNERFFDVSGDNNTIDLTDVRIVIPVDQTSVAHFTFSGSGNTLLNGSIENVYPNGQTNITNYVSYNADRQDLANGNDVHIKIPGNNNSIVGTKMTVRGSFPFGYASYFGIGRLNVFGLDKRGGIQVTGSNTLIDGIELYLEAFGHGIFIQEPGDNLTIRDSLVQGLIRETNDMLGEGNGSLPFSNSYLDADGIRIPANEMDSLAEDGIRAYSRAGSVTVENSVVKNMRGGVRLYLAGDATVRNTVSIDNGLANYNMPNNGTITNSSGNFTYAPLDDNRLSRSRQDIEMTILPSPNAIGSHNIADILGNDHNIVFHRADGPADTQEQRAIVVSGSNSTIRNETEYRIVLESGSSGNTVISAGEVTDNGSNNVSRIALDL